MQLPLAKYMQVKCTCKKVCIDLTTAKGSLFDVINSTPKNQIMQNECDYECDYAVKKIS